MKLILDTHSFLYFIDGNPKLSVKARALIEDLNNEKFISKASLWEMAIKVSIGKLTLSDRFDDLIPQQIALNGFDLLNIEMKHVCVVANLPFHRDHRDPFDRLLIAQSMAEQLPIVSNDSKFDDYQVRRLW
jgi:PIN domain nuclease of toxin-antitoxin system